MIFLGKCILYAVNIPLSMASAAPHSLWQVVFSVLLRLKYFLAPLMIFCLNNGRFRDVFLNLQMCEFSTDNFISSLIPLWSENMLSIIFKFVETCIVVQHLVRVFFFFFGVFGLNFPCILEKFYFPLKFAYSFLVLSCGLFILVLISFSFFFEILNCEV